MAEPITRNAYAILEVSPDSDDQAIMAAYRAMARRYHPDIAGEAATERMMRVNQAFDRIRTPERRAEYDRLLERSGFPRVRRPSPATSTPTDPRGNVRPAPSANPPAPAAHPTREGWRRERDGTGGAGPPPGRPSGSVLGFGRHVGWSIGEIARVDPGYLVWLEAKREGRPYLEEIDRILRGIGQRPDAPPPAPDRRGRRRR